MSKINLEREHKRKQEFRNKQIRERHQKELSPLETLNNEQLKAVYSEHKNNLIIASAGTGKTSTIIGRVVHLLQSGYKPQEIILLTFTSKAGKEMIERLQKHFSPDIVSLIFAGTFHSFGKMLMDKSKVNLKLKNQKQMISLIASIMESTYFMQSLDEPYSASVINGYISLYENTRKNESFDEWLEAEFVERLEKSKTDNAISRVREQIESLDVYQELYDKFTQEKQSHRFCDFNDLLKHIAIFFNNNKNYIKQVIVDEYQDTNNLQNKILQQLAEQGSNIFAVGDYDQSIYGFNGSNVEVVREYAKVYTDVGIYKLSKNYRSSKQILELANRCIAHNDRIIPKELVAMKSGIYPTPELKVYDKISEQYNEIPELIESSEYDINDVAILFRSNNSGNLIEAILIEKNIPTVRVKSNSFFDGHDIATLISVYKIISGSNVTVLDFLNLNSFIKGVNKHQLKMIYEDAVKSEDMLSGIRNHIDNNPTIAQNPYVGSFVRLISEANGVKSPFTIFRLIYDTDCYTHLFDKTVESATKFNRGAEAEEAITQIENKHELLLKIAKSCDSPREFNMKLNFSSKEEDNEYGVKLLTVHASKGLEFKSVIVVDLSEDKFPNLKLAESGVGIDEERRLFYVALTRAEEHLVLTTYKSDDSKKKPKKIEASRFIAECGIT